MKSLKKKVGERRHVVSSTLRDDDGNRLLSRYIGRLPEGKKQSLKNKSARKWTIYWSQNPDLKLVVTADGEKGNWTFSEKPQPRC